MKRLKHIGRMAGTNSKVLVVFRTLPGESDHALVLPVSSLSPTDHDTIMTLVETPQAQDAFEFGEIMFIRTFSDGRSMLQACTNQGILVRVPTDKVIMTPDTSNQIKLSELNVLIAEQKNCAVDDLCKFVSGAAKTETIVEVNDLSKGKDVGEPDRAEYNDAAKTTAESYTETIEPVQAPVDGVLTNTDIAKGMRSQADSMFKEAQRLRKEADELDPKPVKAASKTTKATTAKATKTKAKKADVSG